MSRLFGTAGIRGGYLEKVTPELAYRVGLAVAFYVGQWGSATVGHDVRTTSPLLAQLVAAGLMAGGLDAIYLGLVPTPVLAYSVPHTRSRAGIVVTASHNPPPDNGMKVFDQDGMEYTRNMEDELERLILGDDQARLHASWDRVGRLVQGSEVAEEYVRDLVEDMTVPVPRYRPVVAVDCANGAASNVTPRVLRELGARVVSLNCHPDGFFPGRMPEPRPDVLRSYTEALPSLSVEALLAHDGDADRLAMVLPARGFVKQDLLIALFAREKLKERRGTVIVSVDVGLEVEDVVESMGGRIVRAKLGKTHEKLRESPGAVMAAEPWKLIDPEWGPWVDGVYQAAFLVRISMDEGVPLDRLIEQIPFYPSIRMAVRLAGDSDKEMLYRIISEKLMSGIDGEPVRVMDIDGVRVEFKDRSWVLVRPSGTERKLRVYAQATDRRRLLDIVERIRRIMSEAAEKGNIHIRGVEEQLNLDRTTF
ncbi:MAG: phosphopentomutase/phosphoglucosamine mutase [Desulfurococcales archaeon]|nr:phosphopentomutase/phosphoglucosamine mutase [Desulfurococcales archaeon]